MPRPKCDAFVGFKCPSELRSDVLEIARIAGKTEAEVWKSAMEFRLGFVRFVMADYYDLRQSHPLLPVQPGSLKG